MSNFRLALFFIGFVLLMRFWSFFPSVINHDESTYIVIADGLLKGKTYFKDYVDTKPAGIFLLYAAMLKVTPSIAALRIWTAIWIAGTAFLLSLLIIRLGGERRAAFAAGVIYIFLTSIYGFYGVSPNTELYYTLFTVLAWYLASGRPALSSWALAGLSLGIGFLLKYVVLFDALALGIFLLLRHWRAGRAWGGFTLRSAAMLVCLLVPITAVWWWYRQMGLEEAFRFYTLEVTSRYPQTKAVWDYIKFVGDFLLRYFPVSAMFFHAGFSGYAPREIRVMGLLWSSVLLLPVFITGRMFGHYFIQLMPAFAGLAGAFFSSSRPILKGWIEKIVQPGLGFALLGLVVAANLVMQKRDFYDKPDYPRQIAQWMEARLQPGDLVFTGNYHHIIYYLINQDCPTPYVHRSLIWEPHHIYALQIDEQKTWDDLIAQAHRFVLYQGELKPEHRYTEYLKSSYRPVKRFGKNITIWERRT